ncbi:MAG TPA: Wzz/FepE/Etk N-terminal domain-containing protein [Candidatus Acidoferrum sp.]|nr:Wzz/FepE/Etk N-terminal domain-containing protein [Candidatus Acidoferrum sp.]
MTQTAAKPQPEVVPQPAAGELLLPEVPLEDSRELQAERFRFIWDRRRFILRTTAAGLLAATLVAFLIPKSYTSTAQLMPPDQQSSSALAMMAGMAAKAGGGLGAVAGDLLGIKSSGALFIGMLRSETAEDRLVEKFDLRKVYGSRLAADARMRLEENTSISEDRKSGIISISVTDHNPQRAAAIANAYVDELNSLVAELSTSSAHRERVFLEERLKVAKRDLDEAANDLAQFSSKNNTLDIQQEGKAMLDAVGTIAGELIAAQSQLEGLRQIYTDNNSRVRAMQGRVAELRRQLEKLGGTQGDPKKNSALNSAKNEAARPLPGQIAVPRPGQTADPAADQSSAQSGTLPYPTIRSLPLLGARYADYYRRAKIQETVFELLTQQYELAKVQEAKETPSVKVLDPGKVPERKSFPPRLPIMFLGTVLSLSMSVVWVLGTNRWQQADPTDPRKVLAQEVVATVRTHVPWIARNGHATGPEKKSLLGSDVGEERVLGRLDRRPSSDGPEEP